MGEAGVKGQYSAPWLLTPLCCPGVCSVPVEVDGPCEPCMCRRLLVVLLISCGVYMSVIVQAHWPGECCACT